MNKKLISKDEWDIRVSSLERNSLCDGETILQDNRYNIIEVEE